VKRVVSTSSIVAILSDVPNPTTFTEANWNDQAPIEVERLGRAASLWHKYSTSKVPAERAAWKLWNEQKDAVQWDLVTLNPPFVRFRL
jgi:hypothetical protein